MRDTWSAESTDTDSTADLSQKSLVGTLGIPGDSLHSYKVTD
jgi:hypothetical protein